MKVVIILQAPPGPPATVTEYIQRDRKREESPAPFDSVVITRCDIDQRSILNHDRRTFSTSKLSSLSASNGASTAPTVDGPGQPTLLVETMTVDTGERQQRFGYIARRVLITRREVPLHAHFQPAETRSDGWYIDINPRISCYDERAVARSIDGPLLNAWLFGLRPDHATFRYIGTRESGFAIEETRTFRRQVRQADGTTHADSSSWSMRVTALSTEPHDPALFEIPDDFGDVETSYSPPTPSLWVRFLSAWSWVQYLLRGGR